MHLFASTAATAQETAGSPYNSVFAAHSFSSPPPLFVAALQGNLQKSYYQADYEEALLAQLTKPHSLCHVQCRSRILYIRSTYGRQYSLQQTVCLFGSRKVEN